MIPKSSRRIYLAPVRANVGLQAEYQQRLDVLIEKMNHSLIYWISAAYRANEPEISNLGQDASPARELIAVARRLATRWQRQFDRLAPELAIWFAKASAKRSDEALKASLRKGGFTVKFKPTRAQNDAYQAVIGENVGLIKSIPAEQLTQVEGIVMRSVQVGRDLGPLVRDLEHQFGVTRRRASFIARDQNNKATAVLTRVRHQELGIAEARWQHSHGGKVPRPTHLKASRDRVTYAIKDGWFDPAVQKHVWPGELPNCRCVAIPVIPGFS